MGGKITELVFRDQDWVFANCGLLAVSFVNTTGFGGKMIGFLVIILWSHNRNLYYSYPKLWLFK